MSITQDFVLNVDATYGNFEHSGRKFPLIFKENIFKEFISRSSNILELGARAGINADWISKTTRLKYYGYEPVDEYYMRLLSGVHSGNNIFFNQFHQLPQEEKFDIIFCRNFLDTLISDESELEPIDTFTKKLMTISSEQSLWVFLESEAKNPGWIDRWTERLNIYPDVYIPLWNVLGRCSVDHLCSGAKSTLVIIKFESLKNAEI